MITGITTSLFAVLFFLFLFWKRLKEDYATEIVFRASAFILVGLGTGLIFSLIYFPEWFFWSSLAGGMVGLYISILRLKVKFYETLEAFVFSSIPLVGMMFIKHSVESSSLSSFLGFLAVLLLAFLAHFFDSHYKGFNWYKSGKVGFAGLAVAAIFFLARFTLAIFKVTVLSFLGPSEVIISGIVGATSFLLLFNLGRVKE